MSRFPASRHFLASFCGLILALSPLASAQSTGSSSTSSSAQTTQGGAADSNTKSIHEVRKQTLLYGIDSQVIELLKTLTQDRDGSLGSEAKQVLEQTPNPDLRQAAVEYLTAVKDWSATSFAEKMLSDRIQSGATGNGAVIISAIRYLTAAKDTQAVPEIEKLLQDENESVAYEAVAAIGKLGGGSQASALLADLKDPQFSSKLKPQIILSLGELKSKEAVPELTNILKNQDEDATMRRYACDALGKIGDPSSISAIKEAFSDKDTYLRAYAVAALANFKGSEVDSLLTGALKDSFWRVRVNAAKSLGEKKVASAVPILEYKARYDPEAVVQRAALTALGEIGDAKAIDFLRTTFSNSLVNPALRTVAADELISKDLNGSLTEIEKFLQSEWNNPVSPLFDHVCKQLSQAESPRLEPLFERFLSNPNLNIQIYGLRGIRDNGFKDLLKKVEAFDDPKKNVSVRAAAESAISKLK